MRAKGLNDIKKALKNKGVELNRKADKVVSNTAFVGRNVAVQKAPVAFGKLRQGINIEKGHLSAKVYSQMPYSVYIEFGTGKKVEVPVDTPDELKKVARKATGNRGGSFDDLLTRIERWARKKRIPEEAAYPIALTLVEEGQEPQPFMRPAYKASRKALKIGLKRL